MCVCVLPELILALYGIVVLFAICGYALYVDIMCTMHVLPYYGGDDDDVVASIQLFPGTYE